MSDNPNAFKLWFDETLLRRMAEQIGSTAPGFAAEPFLRQCLDGLDALELKDRVRRIAEALHAHLAPEFPTAIASLLRVVRAATPKAEAESGAIGFWPYCQFVETYGLEHFDASMDAMHELTQHFSAEFAVRPFLERYPTATLARLQAWTSDPSHHVRRWVSEGSRPRLPWGRQLPAFVEDPTPLLPLLEALRHDPEEYVRRSVANHLNDIAKDHPDVVVEIAKRWWKDSNDIERRMIRHALRTLVKQGHAGALAVLGFGKAKVDVVRFRVRTARVVLGEHLEFDVELRSTAKAPQALLVDYAVHHRKANGTTTPKVFKWMQRELEAGGTLASARRHSMRVVTTRRYYPGTHAVEILANGASLAHAEFELVLPPDPPPDPA